jgi:hypothetical protein
MRRTSVLRIVVCLVLVVLVVLVSGPTRADLNDTTERSYAGTCLIVVRAHRGADRIDITTPVPGTCVSARSAGEPEPIHLDLTGWVVPVNGLTPISCREVVGRGGLRFAFDRPSGVDVFDSAALDISHVLGIGGMEFALHTGSRHLSGAASLTQSPSGPTACLDGVDPVSWTLELTFEAARV